MTEILDFFKPLIPTFLTTVLVLAVLITVDRLLKRTSSKDSESDFRNKMIMLGLSLVGLVVLMVAIPFEQDTRGQLLGFLGIVLSAAVALSSTTILGNAMAGLMLRAVGNFRVGDFVQVEEHFGRVTERGFFHTEIQTEERGLTTLPNLFLVTHAVNVIRSSGHILRATVSLGYDVPRLKVEQCLLDAATSAQLEDPFVHILELGDFSVTYRVGGLLKEVKSLLTKRSVLRAEVMDALHGAGVEIVSPNFMNQRVYQSGDAFVPRRTAVEKKPAAPTTSSEDVAFDKAEEAESLDMLRRQKDDMAADIAALRDESGKAETDEQKTELKTRMEYLERRLTHIDATIAKREAKKTDGSE